MEKAGKKLETVKRKAIREKTIIEEEEIKEKKFRS